MTGGDETDEALIAASACGDTVAFGRLVSRYQQLARRLAIALVGATDGDDVAQDSFVRAYRSLASFRDGSAFEPWLRRIVVNESRNHHRGTFRRTRREHHDAIGTGSPDAALNFSGSISYRLSGGAREGGVVNDADATGSGSMTGGAPGDVVRGKVVPIVGAKFKANETRSSFAPPTLCSRTKLR